MPTRTQTRRSDLTGVPQILQDDLEALNSAFSANQAAITTMAAKQQAVTAAQSDLVQAQSAQEQAHQAQVDALAKLEADLAAQYGS